VSEPDVLITDYQHELVEDHHSFGSGRYGLKITLPADISPAFPYLNAVLDDPNYDHENCILIGASQGRRYAFRPHEIQLGMVADPSEVSAVIKGVVSLVNRVWNERDSIEPRYAERKIPPVFEIFRMLPGGNCKECGYQTCLAFAADLRAGTIALEQCPKLSEPEHRENREKLASAMSGR
jgi:ArsR family metal-binding transcriptional regulator